MIYVEIVAACTLVRHYPLHFIKGAILERKFFTVLLVEVSLNIYKGEKIIRLADNLFYNKCCAPMSPTVSTIK